MVIINPINIAIKNNSIKKNEESISGVSVVKFSSLKMRSMGMNKASFVEYGTVAQAVALYVSLKVAVPLNKRVPA